MKKIIFFTTIFAGGVGAGLGNPSPLGAGLGVQFLSPTGLGAGAGLGTVKRGRVC